MEVRSLQGTTAVQQCVNMMDSLGAITHLKTENLIIFATME